MFLSHWFELSGVDQILAPPPNDNGNSPLKRHDRKHGDNDTLYEESPIWELLAPRAKRTPHPSESASTQEDTSAAADPTPTNALIQCQHCYRMTPVCPSSGIATRPYLPLAARPVIDAETTHLQTQVLQAAIQTAHTLAAPVYQWEEYHALFSLCAAPPAAATAKKLKRLVKLLDRRPNLLHVRSGNMNTLGGLPDGYTVLHAGCYVGNQEVVRYLLNNFVMSQGPVTTEDNTDGQQEVQEDSATIVADNIFASNSTSNVAGENVVKYKLDLNERDLQGRTALHIAAERGHYDIISLLQNAYQKMEEQQGVTQNIDLNTAEKQLEDKRERITSGMARLSTNDATEAEIMPNTPHTKTSKKQEGWKVSQSSPPLSIVNDTNNNNSVQTFLPLPSFSGANAPLDLAKRTPLAYASTSPVPKARQNRAKLEKVLYRKGDRSIDGVERTPPKDRCGGRGNVSNGNFSSPGLADKKNEQRLNLDKIHSVYGPFARNDVGLTSAVTSYLSPTPRRLRHHHIASPGSSCTSNCNFATPFQSPRMLTSNTDVPEQMDWSESSHCTAARGGMPLQWGASEKPGWRIDMEDATCCYYPLQVPPKTSTSDSESDGITMMGLFGVFDGHGDGGFASEFISSHLLPKIESHPLWAVAYHGCDSSINSTTAGHESMLSVLSDSFYSLDEDLKNVSSRVRDGGTTAIIALISEGKYFLANVGDSRCILVKKKIPETTKKNDGSTQEFKNWNLEMIEVIPLSEDQKPNLPCERARIESAGLTVQTDIIGSEKEENEDNKCGMTTVVHRVKKSSTSLLGVSRAFGDFDFKANHSLSPSCQAVVCTPEIMVRERQIDEDMYLVLACDGIWDVMSNEEVGLFVSEQVMKHLASHKGENASDSIIEGEVLARVGDDLLEECLERGSRDNMSVLILALPASGLLSSPSMNSIVEDHASRALAF